MECVEKEVKRIAMEAGCVTLMAKFPGKTCKLCSPNAQATAPTCFPGILGSDVHYHSSWIHGKSYTCNTVPGVAVTTYCPCVVGRAGMLRNNLQVGTQYTGSAVQITSTMNNFESPADNVDSSTASRTSSTNLTAVAVKSGMADSDLYTQVFVVTEEVQTPGGSKGNAARNTRGGLECKDLLRCVPTDNSDTAVRVPTLDPNSGDCYCKPV
jgi:hypothetical protein